jgi:hypothetical protein
VVSNTCKQCGQVFFRSGTKTFCGRPCFERWYSINMKGRGPNNRGNRIVKPNGYVHLWMPAHQRATKQGYVREHIVIAEKALGKSLPPGTEVHHVNEKPGESHRTSLFVKTTPIISYFMSELGRSVVAKPAGNPADAAAN